MVDSMPMEQSPEVFGLHANAHISYYTEAAKSLFNCLNALQPKTEYLSSDSKSTEDFVTTVASDLLAKLPQPFDLALLQKDIEMPMQTALLQELELFNALVNAMRESLNILKKALAGEVGMSSDVENLFQSLLNNTLPPQWAKLTPVTEKRLGSWVTWFFRRYRCGTICLSLWQHERAQ